MKRNVIGISIYEGDFRMKRKEAEKRISMAVYKEKRVVTKNAVLKAFAVALTAAVMMTTASATAFAAETGEGEQAVAEAGVETDLTQVPVTSQVNVPGTTEDESNVSVADHTTADDGIQITDKDAQITVVTLAVTTSTTEASAEDVVATEQDGSEEVKEDDPDAVVDEVTEKPSTSSTKVNIIGNTTDAKDDTSVTEETAEHQEAADTTEESVTSSDETQAAQQPVVPEQNNTRIQDEKVAKAAGVTGDVAEIEEETQTVAVEKTTETASQGGWVSSLLLIAGGLFGIGAFAKKRKIK